MAALLFQFKDLSRFDLNALRYVSNTAAFLPPSHIRRLRALWPHVRLYSMYGLTECKRVSYLPPEYIDSKPDSVGIAIPNEEVFILDPQGNELGAGQIGELVVRGRNVMQGYWNDPEETARVFRPGRYRGETYLHTGDLFRKDSEGFLYFVARKDDMLKIKGERVAPREIEVVLLEMDEVAEAAVVGVPDQIWGQVIKAFIVTSTEHGLSPEAVRKYCRQHLEPFLVPKMIVFIDRLPKSANGKVDRGALAQ
jgi:acyl-CoA synthetase (AMP-forming)/AMP-acid ligase II